MWKHLGCSVVALLLLQASCGGRNVPVLDGAADGRSGKPDASGNGHDGTIVKDLAPTDTAVNRSLYAAFFVDKFFADCMPAVPPDPVTLTGHVEFLNNGSISVGPIQFTGAKIVSPTGVGLATFEVQPIAPFVIKPGEGLSPQVKKVPDTLKIAEGACGLCGKSVRVELTYAGAAVPVGAKVVSSDVTMSCAY